MTRGGSEDDGILESETGIEALDKEKRFLEDAMAIIRSRCANERRATQSVLAGLSEHLEHEERAIAQSVAIIHHHRNRLIPIMRLPPEILSRILVFHAQIEWRWLDAALTTTHPTGPPASESADIGSYSFDFRLPPRISRRKRAEPASHEAQYQSYIPWDSGLFSNLVTLEVDGFRVESTDADSPSLDMLLSALTRMPGLELIILQYCLPPPTPVRTTHAYVDLPNLKRLEADYYQRQRNRGSGFQGSNISKADVEEFFTIFPSCLHTALTPIAQALKFTWGRYCGFVVEIWTTQQNTELRSFRISTGHIAGWNAEVWRRLARLVPDLRRLAVETEVQYTEVCKALSPPDEPGAVPADCCFPALSYLELEPPFDRPPPTPDEGESLLSVALARSLAARASIGCSTPELVFVVSCKEYPEGWFDPLRNAVPGILVRVEQWLAEDMSHAIDWPLEDRGVTNCFVHTR
ncbi:hypothetical protein BD779DRAFT_1473672 [Infundibulicybe gibba]|nr:hypothetical protein BD779DRAFT_1473672 [Infundibulicybe gibba]